MTFLSSLAAPPAKSAAFCRAVNAAAAAAALFPSEISVPFLVCCCVFQSFGFSGSNPEVHSVAVSASHHFSASAHGSPSSPADAIMSENKDETEYIKLKVSSRY